MSRGPNAVAVTLSNEGRAELEAMTRSRSLPNFLVRRVRVVLLAAEEKTNIEIGAAVGLSRATVGMWRRRFATRVSQGCTMSSGPGVHGRSTTSASPLSSDSI